MIDHLIKAADMPSLIAAVGSYNPDGRGPLYNPGDATKTPPVPAGWRSDIAFPCQVLDGSNLQTVTVVPQNQQSVTVTHPAMKTVPATISVFDPQQGQMVTVPDPKGGTMQVADLNSPWVTETVLQPPNQVYQVPTPLTDAHVWICLPTQDATLTANAGFLLAADRHAFEAGNQNFILQAALTPAQMNVYSISPVVLGTNYPFGSV